MLLNPSPTITDDRRHRALPAGGILAGGEGRRFGGVDKGWLRYEKMRTLNIQQLSSLQRQNLEGESWDDLIDQLIAKDITE